MINRRVLFVDDEPLLLDTYRRLLGREFTVETADGPVVGLAAVKVRPPYAVIVSDLRMPGMSGVEYLSRVRTLAPDSVRIMVTGFADTEAAVAAVNEGRIFRFLNKPCPHEQLQMALEAGVEQYRLVMAERELLEQTLSGSIRMLTDILGLMNPGVVGRASRVRRTVRHLARTLQLPNAWQYELAGMLSQIGCLTIQPEVLDKVWAGQELGPEEEAIYRSHPTVGSQLLSHIPRLGAVARIIALQQGAPASDAPDSDAERTIALGGLMLQVAVTLDQHLARGLTVPQAVERMRGSASVDFARLVEALATFSLEQKPPVMKTVRVRDLDDTMVFAEDVRARNGVLLVAKGHEVNMPVKFRLTSFAAGVGVVEPFRVWVTSEECPSQAAA